MLRIPRLGPRGEGWVALQTVLIVATVASTLTGSRWPRSDRLALEVLGAVAASGGIGLFVYARVTLGRSFTPLPRPRDDASFTDRGPYRRVRHPVYAGVILAAIGWSLLRAPIGLVPSALLAVVFDLKSRREEAWLLERYPPYDAYRRRTRRFVPLLY